MTSDAIRTLFLAELLNQCRPQTPDLGCILERGLNQHELRGRIDADPLAVLAEERELAPRPRKQPQEIAIAQIWRGFARR